MPPVLNPLAIVYFFLAYSFHCFTSLASASSKKLTVLKSSEKTAVKISDPSIPSQSDVSLYSLPTLVNSGFSSFVVKNRSVWGNSTPSYEYTTSSVVVKRPLKVLRSARAY